MEDELEEIELSLEEEFDELSDCILDEIKMHLHNAEEALSRAVQLSNENGIPFSSGISFIWQTYIPNSYYDKFLQIDPEYVETLTGVWVNSEPDDYKKIGWEHSAIC